MFDVRLEKRYEVRFTKALKAVDKRTRFWKDDLPRYFITLYYRTVLRAIESQRYAANYTPLSKKYREWKKKHAKSTKFWMKTGALRDELRTRSWKAKPVWQGDSAVMYVASLPDEMSWYTEINEWGLHTKGKAGANMTFPARQVFGPTYDNMKAEFEAYTKRQLSELATIWGRK